MFTYVLIASGVLGLVVVAGHEIRSWRRPGRHISQNAPLGSEGMNRARMIHDTNIHDSGPYDMPGGV